MKYLLPDDVIQAITPRHLSCPYNQDITFLLSLLIQLDVLTFFLCVLSKASALFQFYKSGNEL